MSEPVKPDFNAEAESIYRLVRLADDSDMAKRLIKNALGSAFAQGGLKACEMMEQGLGRTA